MKVIQILVRHRDWNVESGLGYGSWTIAAHELPLVIFARNSMVAMTWFLQESCSQLFFFFFKSDLIFTSILLNTCTLSFMNNIHNNESYRNYVQCVWVKWRARNLICPQHCTWHLFNGMVMNAHLLISFCMVKKSVVNGAWRVQCFV